MRINHNIAALNTYRQLNANTLNASKSLERLSSGLRINRAGDDAAGLAISEKMRGQIRGLSQAGRNAQDAISLIQTAEGALNETHSILQRMRELAVQAASDTNTPADRTEIQKEIDQLATEITRISTSTEYNNKTLLNGSMGKTYYVSDNTGLVVDSYSIDTTNITSGTYTLTMTAAGTDTVSINDNDAATGLVTGDIAAASGSSYGTYSLLVTDFDDVAGTANFRLTGPDGTVSLESGKPIDGELTMGGITFSFDQHAITSDGTIEFVLSCNGLDFELTDSEGNTISDPSAMSYTGGTINIGGFEFEVKTEHGANGEANTIVVNDAAIRFHIGANADQSTTLSISDMSAYAMGVHDIVVTTQADANSSLAKIDAAITSVSAERSKLGAMQNRLEHTINNLGTTQENLTASESRIRDVDMAMEMTEFTKNNILSQAAQAMLAQANAAPQGILQLLRS